MPSKCHRRIIHEEEEESDRIDEVNTQMPPEPEGPSPSTTSTVPRRKTATIKRNKSRPATNYEMFMLSIPFVIPVIMMAVYLIILLNLHD